MFETPRIASYWNASAMRRRWWKNSVGKLQGELHNFKFLCNKAN